MQFSLGPDPARVGYHPRFNPVPADVAAVISDPKTAHEVADSVKLNWSATVGVDLPEDLTAEQMKEQLASVPPNVITLNNQTAPASLAQFIAKVRTGEIPVPADGLKFHESDESVKSHWGFSKTQYTIYQGDRVWEIKPVADSANGSYKASNVGLSDPLLTDVNRVEGGYEFRPWTLGSISSGGYSHPDYVKEFMFTSLSPAAAKN